MMKKSELQRVVLPHVAPEDRAGLESQEDQLGQKLSQMYRRRSECYEWRPSNYSLIISSKLIEFEF